MYISSSESTVAPERPRAGWQRRKKLVCIEMELGCKFARQKLALGSLSADKVIVVLPAPGEPSCSWSAETAYSQSWTSPAGIRSHSIVLAKTKQ